MDEAAIAVCEECELGGRIRVVEVECSGLLINDLPCFLPTSLCHLRAERPGGERQRTQ